jgi:hypothetical protein
MKPEDEKLPGWLVAISAGSFLIFVALYFIGVMYPEHGFAKRFLTGGRIWIAGLVLMIIAGWLVAIRDGAGNKRGYQRRSKRSDFG